MNFRERSRPRSRRSFLLYILSASIQNENHRDTGNFCRALPMKRSLREMKVIRIEDSCLVDHAVFLVPFVAHICRLNDFIYDSTVDRHSIADRW